MMKLPMKWCSDGLYHDTGNDFSLMDIEGPPFLRQVKMQYDKQGGVHHDLGVGEKFTIPRGQSFGRVLQFMEKDVARFIVQGGGIPSLINDVHKPGNFYSKVFKLEDPRPSRAPIICEQKRAMVREGRG
jgi:hypothetical protein